MSRLSAFSGSDQEVVPGVLRGYRLWNPLWDFSSLGQREIHLRAMNFLVTWEQGKNEASCLRSTIPFDIPTREHHAPQAGCTCGFYARHDPYFGLGLAPVVAGVIKAYGKVILGTEGFRAQYAEIEALSVGNLGSVSGEAKESLRNRYQVPVYPNRDGMLLDFPPISVQHLLPEPEPSPVSLAWHEWIMELTRSATEETRREAGAEETG